MLKLLRLLGSLVFVACLSGCATHYITPSGRADLSAISSSQMQRSFAARPAAGFPASIAAVRVQEPRYRNYYTERNGGVYGEGRYSVILVKEVEDEADLERLEKLPQVGGLVTLNRLLLPVRLHSDEELREAAARLKADMVLLYTFDTSFHENDQSVALNVISLGLSPTRKLFIHVAASGLLVDTRTGFIYSVMEANEKRDVRTNAWESEEAADRARREAERAAFKKLVAEFEKSWPRVVERAKQGA
jgi:hypothetical protein